jgi:hypothetical protein
MITFVESAIYGEYEKMSFYIFSFVVALTRSGALELGMLTVPLPQSTYLWATRLGSKPRSIVGDLRHCLKCVYLLWVYVEVAIR